MPTQILRTVDRWRFEVPLALVLAGAAGFAVFAMPHALFARLPVVGHRGMSAQIAVAALFATICGVAGYLAMRRPAKAVPIDEDVELADDLDAPSGLSEDRLLRLRRADRHPDAPPRAPIRASRDLGEPFMDVGTPAASAMPDPAQAVEAESAIIDGDYVELDEPVETPVGVEAEAIDAEPEPVAKVVPTVEGVGEPLSGEPVVVASAAEVPAPAPIVPPFAATVTRPDVSIAAMMDRLSAGIERRAGRPMAPTRDMRPALRDALDELNRLAARRG